jgi:hypothetical protein
MDIIGKGYQTAGALSAGVGPMQYFGEEARNNAAEAGYQASLARVKAIAERKAQAEQAAEAAREQAAAEAAEAAKAAKAWEDALIKRNRLAMVDGDAAEADSTARALSLGQSGVAALGGGDLDVGMRMIEREAQAKASAAKAAADATAKAEIEAAKKAESAARDAAERKAEAERKINNLIQQRTAILADQARRRSEDIVRARAATAVEALDARRAQILGENPRERLRDQVAGFAERKKAQKETEKDDQDYKRKIAELEERRARGQRISAKGTDMLAQADAFRTEGHPERWGLWCGGLIVADTTNPTVAAVLADWWAECARWSTQSQVSLPVVCRRHGIRPDTIPTGRRLGEPWLDIEAHLGRT